MKYLFKCLAIDVMRNRNYEEIRISELIKEINKIKNKCDELKNVILNNHNKFCYLMFDDYDDYEIIQNKHNKSYYLKYRYYVNDDVKNALIEIMEERRNERLEVGEAVKMLSDKGFEGLTVRNIRRRLNFNKNDNYEIKKISKTYIVYKSN